MLDALDHLTDILISLAILFLVPLIYIGLKQDMLIRTVVTEQSEQLVDETRSLGYLSKDMFEEFQQSLSKTGLLYDIKLEHKQNILEPEYRFRTLDEVLEEQNKAFTGANVYHYYPVSTNIPIVTDPIDNSGLSMNTETNASVLASAISTPASPGHVHNGDCFSGHAHTASCIPMGKNVKVTAEYSRSYSYPNYATTFTIRCTECLQIIYHCMYYNSDYSGSVYSVNMYNYGYDKFGNRVQVDSYSKYDYGKNNPTQTAAVQTLGSMFYSYATAPGIAYRDTSYAEYIRSNPFIWNDAIPWLKDSGSATTSYFGCTYCGKYGDNWTCGHNEVGIGHEHGIEATYYALHKHTDACYTGTMCTGYDYNGDGYFNYQNDTLQSHYSSPNGSNNGYSITNYYCRGCGKSVHYSSSSNSGSGSSNNPHGISRLNPICGKEGQYADVKHINCYAPKLKITTGSDYNSAGGGSSSSYVKISCENCLTDVYSFSTSYSYANSRGELKLYYMGVGRVWGVGDSILPNFTITNAEAGYQEAMQLYFNLQSFANNNREQIESVSDSNYYYVKAGAFNIELPFIGKFSACINCSDFKIRRHLYDWSDGSPSAGLSITCLHCNKVIMSAGPSSGGSYNSFALFKNGVLQEIIQTNYTDTTPYRQFINAASNPQLTAGVTYYNNMAGYYGSYYQQIQEAIVPYNYYAFNYSFLGPYINHGCSFTKNTYCKMNSSPKLCSQNVVSITPTHPVQSVYTNEPLITIVTATYLDGSKKVVLANTTFSTANPITNKVVTLSYQDAMGKTLTCTITVNVIPRNKTCVNGHIYNLNNDGSDSGCPYCKAWLRSLVIEFPTTPYFNIYRGTTLPENGVTLLATYLDGHTELLESEYIDNLDKNYVGSQSVTMTYKGHYVYLTVVTKRNLKLCTVCHRQYELHPDDTDPGCPWCAALTPIFTGNVMQYYDMKYTEEILKELYVGEGNYRFSDDDFLTISVKSKKGSIGTRLLSAIYLNDNVNTIHVIKAGYVREDGYYYRKYK